MSSPLTHKFVAVLNKKIPVPNLMNALGHMAAGLVGSTKQHSAMQFDDYHDKDGGLHKSISDNPFIILTADNSNKIRTLRNELLTSNIEFVDFTSTMIIGTHAEQKAKTLETPEIELEYFGICMFGPMENINQYTKKFSLWR